MMGSKLRIFIDGAYVFKVFSPYARQGYRFSFKRLQRRLSENYNLIKVHYYNAINLRNPAVRAKQERFYYKYLRDRLGWEMVIHPLQWPGGEAKQKGVDSSLVLQLHDLAVRNEYDAAILIAADADFVPSVELVKQLGKVVHNAYFSARPSFHLQQACNGRPFRLDDLDFVYKDSSPSQLLTMSSLKPS